MGITGRATDPSDGVDALRARTYRLLARLLAAPPDAGLLKSLSALDGDAGPLGLALNALAAEARATTVAMLDDEYHALFIGVGGGELNPFGSYYLTGFLYERPLARLRIDMARLGIARADGNSDPEDHIAALCEMMAGLISGDFGDEPVPLAAQQAFFDAHLGGWASRFFGDLEAAAAARFYRPVGRIGRHFFEIERQAFAMAA
ncbi:MAG TPA: molecular chaperone TorD family protein [Alphaproteobacteria bacterium]|nr:molecular chaperone TorD family protein [Alphaproteobacteria bacterium]